MTVRTMRAWAVLAGITAVAAATVYGSRFAETAAGAMLIVLALLLVRLDGQRKRGGTRR